MHCNSIINGLRSTSISASSIGKSIPLLAGGGSHVAPLGIPSSVPRRLISTGLSLSITTPSSDMAKHLREVASFDDAFLKGKLDVAKDNISRALDILGQFNDYALLCEIYIRQAKLFQAQGDAVGQVEALRSALAMASRQWPVVADNVDRDVRVSLLPETDAGALVEESRPLPRVWSSLANALALACLQTPVPDADAALAVADQYIPAFAELGMQRAVADLLALRALAQLVQLKADGARPAVPVDPAAEAEAAQAAAPRKPFKLQLTSVQAGGVVDKPAPADPVPAPPKPSPAQQRQQLEEEAAPSDGPAARAAQPLVDVVGALCAGADPFPGLTGTETALSAAQHRLWVSAAQDAVSAVAAILRAEGLVDTDAAPAPTAAQATAALSPAGVSAAVAHLSQLLAVLALGGPKADHWARAVRAQALALARARVEGMQLDSDAGAAEAAADVPAVAASPSGPRLVALPVCALADSVATLTSLLQQTERRLPDDQVALARVLRRLGPLYTGMNPVSAEGLCRSARGHLSRAPSTGPVRHAQLEVAAAYAQVVSVLTWNGKPREAEAVKLLAAATQELGVAGAAQADGSTVFRCAEVDAVILPRPGAPEDAVAVDSPDLFRLRVVKAAAGVDDWHVDRYGI